MKTIIRNSSWCGCIPPTPSDV